jgi:AraC-like DNA-binding protein
MKIAVVDKQGSGIMMQFARAIGATIQGRFVHIPESKGGGYITGFSWENGIRVMVRNYHLNEEILVERTNELAEGQDDIVFFIGGIFPSDALQETRMQAEQASVFICAHAISSVLTMPSNTLFRSITLAVPREYLQVFFGHLSHPVVLSILEAKGNFAYETSITAEMIAAAGGVLHQRVPEGLESQYCKLKCEELLCHIFALLMEREAVPTSNMHIKDIKAIYSVKLHLQSQLDQPPQIALLARDAAMSEPKLRKLFKQTFGKGVFKYYQSMRMQEAARLLGEKRLSVSEVGYQLGFTNLSHFSRVFEQHRGIKPKKFSALYATS